MAVHDLSSTNPSPPGAYGRLRWGLTGLASLFWGATLYALLVPNARVALGSFAISLHDASRAAFQAALLTATTVACWRPGPRRHVAVVAAVAAVLLTAGLDSSARRVGDGTEYMAMTLRLADGQGVAFDDVDLQQMAERLERSGWLDGTALTGLVRTADGRWEFQHFWLYSALVAPWARAVTLVGAHPNVAFALVNAAMLLALVWWLSRRGDDLLALVVGIGPIVWWIDKAHTEVFMLSALGAAGLLGHEHRLWGCLAAGAAAAQNPAAAGPLLVRAWSLVATRGTTRADYVALAFGLLTAALSPAYYVMRIGHLSPLLPPEGPHWPGLHALLTPLLDPNVGLLPYAPIYGALVAAGWMYQSAAARVGTVGSCGLLLLAAAQAGNVNHGGTPGMSRYALWIVAAGLPAAAVVARRLQDRGLLAVVVVGTTAAVTWGAFRPALGEGGSLRPTPLAARLWSLWPAIDNPLPEVFAERTSGRDGVAPVPTADTECRKVLTVGTGTEARFPFPCEPAPATPACAAVGALCYANAGSFSPAPPQRRFFGHAIPERSWTLSTRGQLGPIADALGGDLRTPRLGRARHVVTGTGSDYIWIVEGRRGSAIWVYPLAGHSPALTLRFDRGAVVTILDAASHAIRQQTVLAPGKQRLPLATTTPVVVLATAPAGAAPPPAAVARGGDSTARP